MPIVDLTVDNCDKFLKGNILIDFHAEWCGPCKRMEPGYIEASCNFDDIVFARADIDELKDLSVKYKITCMPTLILIIDGIQIAKHEGALSCELITSFVKRNINNADDTNIDVIKTTIQQL